MRTARLGRAVSGGVAAALAWAAVAWLVASVDAARAQASPPAPAAAPPAAAAGSPVVGPAPSDPARVLPPEVAGQLRAAFAAARPPWTLGPTRVERDHVEGRAIPAGGTAIGFRLDDPAGGCSGARAGGFCLRFSRLASPAMPAGAAGPEGAQGPDATAIDGLRRALDVFAPAPWRALAPQRDGPAAPEPRPAPPADAGVTGAAAAPPAPHRRRDEVPGAAPRPGPAPRPVPRLDLADLTALVALAVGLLGGLAVGWRQRAQRPG